MLIGIFRSHYQDTKDLMEVDQMIRGDRKAGKCDLKPSVNP